MLLSKKFECCNLVNNAILGYVVHMMVPEAIHFTMHNQHEAYKSLLYIVLGPQDGLYFFAKTIMVLQYIKLN